MPKVLISDKLSPAAVDIFKHKGVDVDVKTGLSPDELKAIIGDYDGLAIRSATKVTADILSAATHLKVVGRAGIGVDNVDIPAATARGVVVMNTPFGNSITTAEHALSMMMALARDIPQANASTHAGKWEKNRFMGVELCGKTLGLVGCGNIGSIVADRAQGLKMHVVAYDPFLTEARAAEMNIEKVELDTLFQRADFITLHTPLNDSTRNIISREALAKCKKGVRIINCARGGLIDEAALKDALESGHVAGAALDVFAEEPAHSHPLFGMENVICTPHLGASTLEAQEKVALQVAEQMAEYLTKGSVTNALNMPSVSAEDAKRLAPYIQLADTLGSFAGQISETGLKSVRIEFEGTASTLNTRPLVSALLRGLLAPQVESVNMINAPLIAKERGIALSELKRDNNPDYRTLVRLVVESERRTRVIEGTLFNGKVRLVNVHDIKLEASLSEHMLYVNNEDKPGFIGQLGMLLGEAGVNIANFHLGRNHEGGEALALVELDAPVSDDLLGKIAALPQVKAVKNLHF